MYIYIYIYIYIFFFYLFIFCLILESSHAMPDGHILMCLVELSFSSLGGILWSLCCSLISFGISFSSLGGILWSSCCSLISSGISFSSLGGILWSSCCSLNKVRDKLFKVAYNVLAPPPSPQESSELPHCMRLPSFTLSCFPKEGSTGPTPGFLEKP
jgi:hypothetical protein